MSNDEKPAGRSTTGAVRPAAGGGEQDGDSRRARLELVLPGGATLRLAVRLAGRPTLRCLRLEADPPPENDAALLRELSRLLAQSTEAPREAAQERPASPATPAAGPPPAPAERPAPSLSAYQAWAATSEAHGDLDLATPDEGSAPPEGTLVVPSTLREVELESAGDLDLDQAPPASAPAAPAEPRPSRQPRTRPPRPLFTGKEGPVVGIDFGTSYSSIAVYRGKFMVVPNELGELQTASAVSFPGPGQTVIGQEARRRMAGEAQWTIASPKRLLGRPYKDPQVAQQLGGLAFRTFQGTDKFTRFEAHGRIYAVDDICAMILTRLRQQASDFFGAEVRRAVFAVPVAHGSIQRSALELAARQAGLEIVSIMTEPAASMLTHGLHRSNLTVAVYDFGGGTFDFCVLRVRDTAFQVLCAGGDGWLGGDDFDIAIARRLADLFHEETGVDLRTRAVEWQALLFACEQAKRELTHMPSAEVRLPDLIFTSTGRKGLRYRLTRKEMEQLTRPLVDKSLALAAQILGQAGLKPRDVDEVVVSGGTSVIPQVRAAVTQLFGRAPRAGEPDLAVVKGAALRAAELEGVDIDETVLDGRTLKEVAGRTIGAVVRGGPMVTLFERSTPLPAEARCSFATTESGQTEMVVGLFETSEAQLDSNRGIGKLRYKGIRAAPAGERQVDFTFLLDEDGVLHVTARVEGKEYQQTIRLR